MIFPDNDSCIVPFFRTTKKTLTVLVGGESLVFSEQARDEVFFGVFHQSHDVVGELVLVLLQHLGGIVRYRPREVVNHEVTLLGLDHIEVGVFRGEGFIAVGWAPVLFHQLVAETLGRFMDVCSCFTSLLQKPWRRL